ncbi:MAG TPA: cupredoxin family copper-binding protein [Roseiflexaceae bacterium]|nr:cupredoxin family copper-binding protein [Roseiflexaceae bacterium]
MMRRFRFIPFMAALAMALMAFGSAGAAPRQAETKSVTIQNFAFDPKDLTINVGDTVTWKNNDQAPHTATAGDGSFDSGNLNTGQEFSKTFDKAGTFAYVCRYHSRMTATLVVNDPSSSAPAPAPAAPAAPAPAPAQQAATGSLEASDQPLANQSVTVAKVTSSGPGWMVIHLDDNGNPGKVLGQTAVPAGDSSNVVVKLSENVPVGGKVWPMLHVDAGAVGTYEFPGADVPVKNGNDVVMKQITITAGTSAAPAGQPTQLPNTGGSDDVAGMMILAALALVLAGGALALRSRRA